MHTETTAERGDGKIQRGGDRLMYDNWYTRYNPVLSSNNKLANSKDALAMRWNLQTAVKLAHSQNCRPQSRKNLKWNLCNCDCCKTCTQRPLQTAEMEKFKEKLYLYSFFNSSREAQYNEVRLQLLVPFDTDMPRKRHFPYELF